MSFLSDDSEGIAIGAGVGGGLLLLLVAALAAFLCHRSRREEPAEADMNPDYATYEGEDEVAEVVDDNDYYYTEDNEGEATITDTNPTYE